MAEDDRSARAVRAVSLVLCSSSDLPAVWTHRALRAAGLASVELVTSEMLALTTNWEHRLGAAGVSTSFVLPDGRRVASEDVGGVLNRMMAPPEALIAQAVPADRDYVQQEITALYLSWLNSLAGPVVNRPTPQGMAGRWRHTSEWAMVAYEAGFSVPLYRQTGHDPTDRGYASLAPADAVTARVIVLDGTVFGLELPDPVAASCARLAELSNTELLGIDLFATRDSPWTFAWATPLPDLQIGGMPLVRRLGEIIGNRAMP